MDRSLLSHADVIKASRSFVCIRTATYEDQEEANFQKEIFFGGEGDLRNFGYAILSPEYSRRDSTIRRPCRRSLRHVVLAAHGVNLFEAGWRVWTAVYG